MTPPPSPDVPTVDGASLRALLRAGRRLRLVHGADAAAFREGHIPGSLRFANADVAARVLRPDEDVVVYGGDARCPTSPELVARLRALGFTRARWYAGGLDEWVATGGSVEGTGPGR